MLYREDSLSQHRVRYTNRGTLAPLDFQYRLQSILCRLTVSDKDDAPFACTVLALHLSIRLGFDFSEAVLDHASSSS